MMSQMKKHVTPIPPNVKHPGFKIRCTHCDTYVTKTCLETSKDLAACSHPEKLEYRSVIHLPNTKHGRRVKTHDTTSLNEAIIAHLQFREKVLNLSQAIVVPPPIPLPTQQVSAAPNGNEPRMLIEWAAKFIAHVNDVDTPNHLKQNLSKEYREEIEREIKRMCLCLSTHFNLRSFGMDNLDDAAVGHVCDYLTNVEKYAPRTFNKHMTTYTMFYGWWQKKIRHNGENLFGKVQHKKTEINPQTIENIEEFESLIALVSYDNGWIITTGKKKQKRQMYRPWLEKAFRIGLESGCRRQNLVYLRASDIIEDDSGPIVLRIENLKVNNLMHITDAGEKKIIYVPLTASLKSLVIDDYNAFKVSGVDNYLLAPEKENRKQMADDISRGFSHFYRQLNTGRELEFGSLRKKYITEMEIFTGGRAEEITGHSNDRVLRHYRVPHLIAKAAREFQVYPEQNDRQKELTAVRENRGPEKTIEL